VHHDDENAGRTARIPICYRSPDSGREEDVVVLKARLKDTAVKCGHTGMRLAWRLVTRFAPGAGKPGFRLKMYNNPVGHALAQRLDLRRREFERAYATGAWTSTGESLSGNGSSLEATEQVRAALPRTLRDLGVRVLLDVPCGDWNWMSHVQLPVERYIGGDLVPSVVERNRTRFADERHEFRVIDLCTDRLLDADLLLCRDALIHFSYADIWRALQNVARADITYFATTTFPATEQNEDLVTGIEWRHLNVEAAPFGFPPPLTSLPEGFNRADQVLSVWRVADLRPLLPRR
jgi:hypothetical protein